MSEISEDPELKDLDSVGIISFDGITRKSLLVHPDQKHLLFPMGNNITIKNIESGTQSFLSGHTNLISALCVSPCGQFVASGQVNHLGFKAMVILWHYNERKKKSSYEIHKVRVEDLCFTCNSNYLISLGGRDDGNLIIWDLKNDQAICGSYASNEIAGSAWTIVRTSIHDQCFISGGESTLKVWRINPETRKLNGVDIKVGKIKRNINCIVIDNRDEFAYCGTASGDIIRAKLNFYHNMRHMEPVQPPVMTGCYSKIPKDRRKLKSGIVDLYPGGVTSLLLLNNDKILVGSGGGTVEMIQIVDIPMDFKKGVKLPSTPQIKTIRAESVSGGISSMILYKNDNILIGTTACEIYQIKLKDFDMRLLVTCHTNTIYTIAFPHNHSEIFATGSKDDIRLWRVETQRELIRISVPNFVCSCLCFSFDGSLIISGWNDGIVRAFTPQTGKLTFSIFNAHLKAVSAVTITRDARRIVSAGCDSQVRVWDIKPDVQRLFGVLKEHRGPVTSLCISSNDELVVSTSVDGTCIIWDIKQLVRKQILLGQTMFMAACFSPNDLHILTCGTDRKIAYWETLSGSQIRELEGSAVGAINCIDISPDCQYFVTGSNDSIVKLWHYHNGEITHIGLGHAAIITGVKFSPDAKYIVSVSAEGAIIIWKSPFELRAEEEAMEEPSSRSTCSIREEDWKKLRLKELENDGENISKLTSSSRTANSTKVVYEGNSGKNQRECNHAKLPQSVCECKNDDSMDIICSPKLNNSSRSYTSKLSSVNSEKNIKEKSSSKIDQTCEQKSIFDNGCKSSYVESKENSMKIKANDSSETCKIASSTMPVKISKSETISVIPNQQKK